MNIFNKIVDITIVAILTITAMFLCNGDVMKYVIALIGFLVAASISSCKNYK